MIAPHNDPTAETVFATAFRLGHCGGCIADILHKYTYTFHAGLTTDGRLVIKRVGHCTDRRTNQSSKLPTVHMFLQGRELKELFGNDGVWPDAFLADVSLRFDVPPNVETIWAMPITSWSPDDIKTIADYFTPSTHI